MTDFSIARIVKNYRGELSLRDFEKQLSEKLPERIGHQSIKDWEEGTKPRYYLMIAIALHYEDWRRKFALEILAEINPEWARQLPEDFQKPLNLNLK